MATNFPTGSDNFTVPNSPGSTALSSSGSGSRNHVQHHRDLGDAIEAMQVEATLAVHSHDSATARHGNKLLQANTHGTVDTDAGPTSIHHTLGHAVNQAAPGNHASLPAFQDTHGSVVSWPVGSIFVSTSASNPSGSFGGTWVQIQDAFLVGAGGVYSYTGSVVNNTSTHTHTIADTTTAGSHTHTLPNPTGSVATHTHTSGDSGGTNVSHTHGTSGNGSVDTIGPPADSGAPGGFNDGSTSHGHSLAGSPVYDSGESNHTHSISNYAAGGGHAHSVNLTVSGSTHSHTASASTTANLPPWKSFYVWQRTA